jgi:hypothetical protein
LLLPALCGVSENGIHLMMELTWATSAVGKMCVHVYSVLPFHVLDHGIFQILNFSLCRVYLSVLRS